MPSVIRSPFISFANATENRRADERDLKIPQFARVAGFDTNSSSRYLRAPIPSFSFPAAAVIPSTPARTNIGMDVTDIFTIAAAGSGYVAGTADVTVVGGGGTGAQLSLVVSGSGGIVNLVVVDPGTGYSSAPTVSLRTVAGGGAGSGGSITVSDWVLTGYVAFIELGGYVVLLKAEGEDRKIRWCAPGRTSVWDEYEKNGDIWVKTGAGRTTLKGSGALEQGLVLGSLGVLFDATGIGVLAQTGDWEAPWTYAKTLNETTAESQVRELNGAGYFVGYDGQIWQTSGYAMNLLGGALDLNQVTEITWPPVSTPLQFAFDSAYQRWVGYDSTTYVYVDKETGAYTTSAATKYITTGALDSFLPIKDQFGNPGAGEAYRTHVQRVVVTTKISGTYTGSVTIVGSIKGISDAAWTDLSAVTLTAAATGIIETTLEFNRAVKRPQIKLTYTTQTGATVEPQGMVVVYNEGGLL